MKILLSPHITKPKYSTTVPFKGERDDNLHANNSSILNISDISNHYYAPISMKQRLCGIDEIPNLLEKMSSTYGTVCNYDNGHMEPNPACDRFLNILKSFEPDEQKAFVQKYKELTGFPDLNLVNSKMRQEMVKSINYFAENTSSIPLYAGFNSSCSTAKNLALPGSDMDGMAILINTKYPEYTQNYRCNIGCNTNQVILQAPITYLPEVISVQEFEYFINEAERIFEEKNFSKEKLEKFENNIKNLNKNFVEAADFNMELAKEINRPDSFILVSKKQHKHNFLATCMLIENYRQKKDENTLINNIDGDLKNLIENSCLYKYSNITQQETLSKLKKEKLKNREDISKDFENWRPEKQFKFVQTMIKHAFDKKIEDSNEFLNVWTHSDKDEVYLGSNMEMYRQLTKTNGEYF